MRHYKKNTSFQKRHGDVTTLGDALNELLANYKLESKYKQTQIIQAWERLMGKPIASRTQKLFIKDKKLYIKLNSAALKQELNMSKSRILSIFFTEFGDKVIEDVIFL